MVIQSVENAILDQHILDAGQLSGQSKPVLILNSRQSKTPVGSDTWVKMTIEAVRSCVESGAPVIASIGMNTWELILWAVGEYGGRAVIIFPQDTKFSSTQIIRSVSYDFNLDPEKHSWVFVPSGSKNTGAKSWWELRDNLALELAGKIIPVSVRDGGRLEGFVTESEKCGKDTDVKFRVGYEKRSRGHTGILLPDRCREFIIWNNLTHWTCRCYGPWPGERPYEFYSAIVESGNIYPRAASATLRRILTEKKLRASGQHIREGTKVVAFTSLRPDDALPLMRWRKRYVRPTFEPYGIAINYRAALVAGIRPVKYVRDGEIDSAIPPELHQGYGTGEWPNEKEWRAIGDVDLSALDIEDITVIVPDENEAERFREITDYDVISLGSEIAV